MKQYCGYCVHLHTSNGIWCDEKEKEMSESTAKSVNCCDKFAFCKEDAFFETDGYKPRTQHAKCHSEEVQGEQMQIVMEGNDG